MHHDPMFWGKTKSINVFFQVIYHFSTPIIQNTQFLTPKTVCIAALEYFWMLDLSSVSTQHSFSYIKAEEVKECRAVGENSERSNSERVRWCEWLEQFSSTPGKSSERQKDTLLAALHMILLMLLGTHQPYPFPI